MKIVGIYILDIYGIVGIKSSGTKKTRKAWIGPLETAMILTNKSHEKMLIIGKKSELL